MQMTLKCLCPLFLAITLLRINSKEKLDKYVKVFTRIFIIVSYKMGIGISFKVQWYGIGRVGGRLKR